MGKGVEKLFRKLVMSKYPMYLDVYVVPYAGISKYSQSHKKPFEVFLVIHEKDFREDGDQEIEKFIKEIAKYVDVEIMGIYNEVVDDNEWEEMKTEKKD